MAGMHTTWNGGRVSLHQLGGTAARRKQLTGGTAGLSWQLFRFHAGAGLCASSPCHVQHGELGARALRRSWRMREAAWTRRRHGVHAVVGTAGAVGIPNTVRGGRYLKHRPPPGHVSSVRSDIDGPDLARFMSRLPRQAQGKQRGLMLTRSAGDDGHRGASRARAQPPAGLVLDGSMPRASASTAQARGELSLLKV